MLLAVILLELGGFGLLQTYIILVKIGMKEGTILHMKLAMVGGR